MEQCVFCQAALQPGQQVCWRCNRAQPGAGVAPSGWAPTQRSGSGAPGGWPAPRTELVPLPPPPSGPPGWVPTQRAPAGSQPWQAAPPPPSPAWPVNGSQPWPPPQPFVVMQPPIAPAPKSSGSKVAVRVIVILALVAVVVIGGGVGLISYVRLHPLITAPTPHPSLTVFSEYLQGSTPVGAAGTQITVTGENFSANSTITFLLDGKPTPGGQTKESDAIGYVDEDLNVTSAWAPGPHALTAKDTQGYSSKTAVSILIVAPGQAGTPAPNGAPSDSDLFLLEVQVSGQDSSGQAVSLQEALNHDPMSPAPGGGTVCDILRDVDAPQQDQGTLSNSGLTYTATITWSCAGSSYKAGHLVYIETASAFHYVLSNGETCSTNQSFVYQHLEGTFTSHSAASGTFQRDHLQIPCNGRTVPYLFFNAAQGTWTGTA